MECDSFKGTQTSCTSSAVGVTLTPGPIRRNFRVKTFTCPLLNISFFLYLYYNLELQSHNWVIVMVVAVVVVVVVVGQILPSC